MSGAMAMIVVGIGYLLVIKNVAIWMLNKNEEFLVRQVPKIGQLEVKLERLIELCGGEEEG